MAEICRLLSRYLRLRESAARRDPHLFGPHALRYHADTRREVEAQRQIHVALDKVYGPSPPGEKWHPDAVWRERYAIPPNQQKRFRKWFREQYGD